MRIFLKILATAGESLAFVILVAAAIVTAHASMVIMQRYFPAGRGCPCGVNCTCNPKCSNGCSQCPVIRAAPPAN